MTEIVSLPMAAHVTKIAPIPGQPHGETYAVVSGAVFAQAAVQDAAGYVVRMTGRHRVVPLAVVSTGMKVYSVTSGSDKYDEHTAWSVKTNADLWLARWRETGTGGAVQVDSEQEPGFAVTVGEYMHRHDMYRFAGTTIDFGSHGECWYEALEFMACAWLGLCHIPRCTGRKVGAGGGRIGELFTHVLRLPLPDALDALIWRGATQQEGATDFERFAARQLIEAGAGEIRGIAAQHRLELVRLTMTNMFWIRCDETLEGLQRDAVLAVEAALNRMSFVEIVAREHDNDMGMLATPSERECYTAADLSMHMTGTHMTFIDDCAREENPWLAVGGARAQRGGNWDAHTRFAGVCERLRLPFRLEYRCDVDVDSGEMAVLCSVPTGMMFPSGRLNEQDMHEDIRDLRGSYAASYALRLAFLMAHTAFCSSLNVTCANVTCTSGSLSGDPLLSLRFDRRSFAMHARVAAESGALDNPLLDNDPLAIYHLLAPDDHRIRFGADRELLPVEPLPEPVPLAAQRVALCLDERPLPESLRALVRADMARELDVMDDDEVVPRSEIADIVRENEDSPLTASIELESVLLRLEDAVQGSDTSDDEADEAAAAEFAAQLSEEYSILTAHDGTVDFAASGPTPACGTASHSPGRIKSLYCERPLMRLIVGIDGNDDTIRYERVPDAMFDAKLLLGRIDRESGNRDRALGEQRECIQLAPTTAQAYIDMSMTYAQIDEDYDEAADMLIRALRTAVMPADIAFCYYRLAYAMWQQESYDIALACYTKALECPGTPFYAAAQSEMNELVSAIGRESYVTTSNAADGVLEAAGIPVAPVPAVVNLIARAVVGLVDAGFPLAADEGAWFLGRLMEGDTGTAVSDSLRLGARAV